MTITTATAKVKKAARHFIRFLPVRGILAALLLCAVVAVVLPLSPVSATSACHLDCCAGRAQHSAGSCMTGACHARIKIKRHAHVQSLSVTANEELCGLSSRPAAVARRLAAANLSIHKTTNKKSTQSELSATAVSRPCPPDCCSGLASAFGTAKQSRKAFGRAQSLRPQSIIGSSQEFAQSVKSHAALCRRSIPRGPPLSFA
jgi:hypothetical protein